jgi:glucosyl-dolichyl phosphate glucuronosyltransferase
MGTFEWRGSIVRAWRFVRAYRSRLQASIARGRSEFCSDALGAIVESRLQSLDVLVATYNRASSLESAVRSLFACRMPEGIQFRIYVIDNNSTDNTEQVTLALAQEFDGRVRYLKERRQGQPFALNTGISESTGDLVAFFDDDERAPSGWIMTVVGAFEDDEVDFISGSYRPLWEAPRPAWLADRYLGIVGVVDRGNDAFPLHPHRGDDFLGGNSVVRRRCFDKAGVFGTWLTYGNDSEFGMRLVKSGARGWYLPGMVVDHIIPAARLTKSYVLKRAYMNHLAVARLSRHGSARGEGRMFHHVRALTGRLVRELTELVTSGFDSGKRLAVVATVCSIAGVIRGTLSRQTDIPGGIAR